MSITQIAFSTKITIQWQPADDVVFKSIIRDLKKAGIDVDRVALFLT
jgi:hypothetical protein